jgi:hypothetical protein
LTITNYQIVNGLQTSHILFHLKDHLRTAFDVLVPVKIAVSHDPVLRYGIAESTNLQTEVSPFDFLSSNPVVRAIDRYFTAQGREVLFERRQGQLVQLKGEERRRVVTLSELMLAYASMVLELPHVVRKGRKKIEDKALKDIFATNQPAAVYWWVARLFIHARRRCQAQDAHGLPDFTHHCAFALRLMLAPAPMPPSPGCEQLERLAEDLEAGFSSRQGDLQQEVERAFQLARKYAERSKAKTKNLLVLVNTTSEIRREVLNFRS